VIKKKIDALRSNKANDNCVFRYEPVSTSRIWGQGPRAWAQVEENREARVTVARDAQDNYYTHITAE
jgi:hypothetical protein